MQKTPLLFALISLAFFYGCASKTSEELYVDKQLKKAQNAYSYGDKQESTLLLNNLLIESRNIDDLPAQVEVLILLSKLKGDAAYAQEALAIAVYLQNRSLIEQSRFALALSLYPDAKSKPYFETCLEASDARIKYLSYTYLYKLTGDKHFLSIAYDHYRTADDARSFILYEMALTKPDPERIVLLEEALKIDKTLKDSAFIKRDLLALAQAYKAQNNPLWRIYQQRSDNIR